MRRPLVMCALAALALSLAAAPLALGQGAPPRGFLTSSEYAELLATQNSVNPTRQLGTPVSIAQRDCRSLTNISRLISTQHAECVSSLLFFYAFFQFAPVLVRCNRYPVRYLQILCLQQANNAVANLARLARGFIRADTTSATAAKQRGLTGQCLAYLTLTAPQSAAMSGLVSQLQGLARAIRLANANGAVNGVLNGAKRVDAALTIAGESFDTAGTVNVCQHQ